jgi:glutathione S-transferase
MIVVHHLENSRSQRVLWLLEELGLPYDVKRYARNPQTMRAPPELKAVHPLGKSPVITDGDTTVAESGAIVDYLVETYGAGRLAPAAGAPEWRRYRYYMHFAEGSMMPPLLMKLIFTKLPANAPALVRPIARAICDKALATLVQPQLDQMLAFLESELSGRDWFAGGDFSAADIQMSFPLEGAAARGGLDTRYPRLSSFLQRIHAMPGYRRALEKGGPYALLK